MESENEVSFARTHVAQLARCNSAKKRKDDASLVGRNGIGIFVAVQRSEGERRAEVCPTWGVPVDSFFLPRAPPIRTRGRPRGTRLLLP